MNENMHESMNVIWGKNELILGYTLKIYFIENLKELLN